MADLRAECVTVPAGDVDGWLASRPPAIRALAEEFPLGMQIIIDDLTHWLIGYAEPDQLIITPFDPAEDFQAARLMREMICASHCREARKSDG